MTPAGVGKIRLGDPKPTLHGCFTWTNFLDFLASSAQGAAGKPRKKAKQARRFSPKTYKCSLSEKATIAVLNGVQPTNRRPFFTRKNFKRRAAPGICRKTCKSSLSWKNLVLRTTGQTLPMWGLPQLPELVFEKAHGAPVAWEKLKRSTPQNELEKTGELEASQNQKPRTPHCHIFESLPGLNGSALNRHRD